MMLDVPFTTVLAPGAPTCRCKLAGHGGMTLRLDHLVGRRAAEHESGRDHLGVAETFEALEGEESRCELARAVDREARPCRHLVVEHVEGDAARHVREILRLLIH